MNLLLLINMVKTFSKDFFFIMTTIMTTIAFNSQGLFTTYNEHVLIFFQYYFLLSYHIDSKNNFILFNNLVVL